MIITAGKTINAPREDVFAAFTDIEALVERIDGITAVEILSDVRSGLGTRWRETRVMMGREATEDMEIAEIDPPSSYVVTAESHGTRYRSTYRFDERDGATDVAMEFEGVPVSMGAKAMSVLGYLFSGKLRKALEADMDDLAAVCEGRT